MPSNLQRNQILQVSDRRREQLSTSFSLWELSGRGWLASDYETELEPLFSRFIPPQRAAAGPFDDARVPRRSLFGRLFSNENNSNPPTNNNDVTANNPVPLQPPHSPVETASFRLFLSSELKLSSGQTEQLLLTLASCSGFTGFEIISTSREIVLQITCPEKEKAIVSAHLKSHLPNLDLRESAEDLLKKYLEPDRTHQSVLVDFGLEREWFIPLPFGESFAADPLLPLIAGFESIAEDETACLQILFCRTRGDWQRAVQEAIFDKVGKPVFANLQNHLLSIKEKLSHPLLAAVVRFAARSDSKEKSIEIARRAGAFFKQFSAPSGNALVPLKNENSDEKRHLRSFVNRTTFRGGMLLSARELSTIVHLPSGSVQSPKLKRDENLTRRAPDFVADTGSLILGENRHAGRVRKISLTAEERIKHMHLVGASGSGKSTLLLNMIFQDLESGNGFACFDPHGDLIDAVLERIGESRRKDVILFDPADEDFPIGFNILSAHSELEKTLLASDLISIFRRFSTSWGDVMNSVLANAVLAFLESETGGSLLDLKRFFVERSFREEFLKTVKDEEIRYYWQNEFSQLKGKPFAPLLTRLDTFLRSKLIRHIVSQKENRLDFRRIMDERKVLLVRLSLGAIGEENAYLLGSLLVSKLYQATLSRQNVAEGNRPPFFLYLDEAHHFVAESMNQILSGVRKYKLGLVLAHQQLRQFQSGETDVLASVLANCFTRICFRLDDADAERLAKGFAFFTAEHLKNLGVGEAICRFEQSRHSFNLETFPVEKVSAETARQRKIAVIEQTRKNYAKTKAEVEAEYLNCRQNSNIIIPVQPVQSALAQNTDNKISKENETSRESKGGVDFTQTEHGRGGRHHREIQAVIKRMSENFGFQVQLEKSVLEGTGYVDVSLERENLKIACEVSVTSTTDYETKNVLKCLAAGYDYALVVVSNQKKIPALQAKLRAEVPIEQQNKVKAFGLTGLLAFLREVTMPPKQAVQKKRGNPNSERLNFTETCEFFNVGTSTLYRWINQGRIPYFRVGREYRFDRGELCLLGKREPSGKGKTKIKLPKLKKEKNAPKGKKQQDERYRKLLKL